MVNSYKVTRKLYLIGISLLMMTGVLASFTVSAPVTPATTITSQICLVYNTVHTVIFILALALIITGAVLYAAGNVLPSTTKGAAQGYGLGMIMGGIVGVVIALLAPYILGLISGTAASTIAKVCV